MKCPHLFLKGRVNKGVSDLNWCEPRRECMCRYLIYVLWCAASIILFISSLLMSDCPNVTIKRRLSVQRPVSAFALLTNNTPVDHDLVVAIRCDMVHQDETFDICNPSSTPTRSSSIVQRDARSYDRIMMRQYQTPENSEGAQSNGQSDKPDKDSDSDGESDGKTYVPRWMLIASSSVLFVVVILHTSAIALSATYLWNIMHAPTWLVAIVRMVVASFALFVGVISFFTRCQTDPLFVCSAVMVYVGCLLEPYGQGLWIASSDV